MLATKTGRQLVLGVALVVGAILLLLPMVLGGLLSTRAALNSGCIAGAAGSAGGPASALADDAIPSNLMAIFRGAERRYGVPWNVLAGINKVETDFGRNLATSSAGAVGWMQFMPDTWAKYGVDADHDGRKDVNDPDDAIFSAARYLKASDAPADLHRAILAYNPAEWYYQEVISWARRYAQGPTLASPMALAAGPCQLTDTGVPGKVTIAPGANLPGRPITPETMAFLARMAGIYGAALIVTTGTNHSEHTVDGNVSDHFDGHAADLGMVANGGTDDGPVGDRIMTACLIAAGVAPARAARQARAGGLYTLEHDGLRIQCIWKTDAGGNHHDHVHAAARPL